MNHEVYDQPLIDERWVPPGVFARGLIPRLNALINQLRSRRVDRIQFEPEPGSVRLAQMVCAHNQAYLWRCVDLLDSAAVLVRTGHGLGAVLLAPVVYETVAAFVDFKRRVIPLLEEGDAEAIRRLVQDTAIDAPISREGAERRLKLMLDQLRRMDELYDTTSEHHEFMSDYRFPDASGVYHWFTLDDGLKDEMIFSDPARSLEQSMWWLAHAAFMLTFFLDAYCSVEAALMPLQS